MLAGDARHAHRWVLHAGVELEQLGDVAAQLRHGGDLIELVVVHHPRQAPYDLRGNQLDWWELRQCARLSGAARTRAVGVQAKYNVSRAEL